MIRSKSIGLATGLILAGLWGLCGLSGCGTSAAATDAGASTDTPSAMGRTYDYAITSFAIDENSRSTVGHTGFNLDGRFSPQMMGAQQPADCSHGDFFSTIDPDQNQMSCAGGTAGCLGGIDNQLPELANVAMMLADLRMLIRNSVTSGSLSLLVRLDNVNDLTNDPSVDITIYQGRPMFASCANIGMANQPYAIDTASFEMGTTTPRFRFSGSIVSGRLRLTPSSGMGNVFQLPLPAVMGQSLTVNMYNTAIRVSVSATGGTDGNLGGYVLRSDLLTTLMRIPQAAMFATIIMGLIDGLVDIQTGTPASCDAPAGGIGMGLGFTMTNAMIQTATVTGAQPMMCGTM